MLQYCIEMIFTIFPTVFFLVKWNISVPNVCPSDEYRKKNRFEWLNMNSASGWNSVEFNAFHTIYLLPIRFFAIFFNSKPFEKMRTAFKLMYQCQPSFWYGLPQLQYCSRFFSLSPSFLHFSHLFFVFSTIQFIVIYTFVRARCSWNAEFLLFMDAEWDRDNGLMCLVAPSAVPTTSLDFFFHL